MINKRFQISLTLSWFIATLIIFFLGLIFLFFLSLSEYSFFIKEISNSIFGKSSNEDLSFFVNENTIKKIFVFFESPHIFQEKYYFFHKMLIKNSNKEEDFIKQGLIYESDLEQLEKISKKLCFNYTIINKSYKEKVSPPSFVGTTTTLSYFKYLDSPKEWSNKLL
ncbi:MAG: hypothetical protein QW273_02595, partial [Candidatus Pacearchaeota archaeon]